MAGSSPLIKLEENASAPILRYDIPEPTSYSGFNLIELNFDMVNPIFKKTIIDAAKKDQGESLKNQSSETIKKRIVGYFAFGLGGRELGIQNGLGFAPVAPNNPPHPLPLPEDPGRPTFPFGEIELEDITQKVQNGERIVIDDNVNGA